MNERIKQLADQAWREILDETSIDGDSSNVYSPDEVVAFEQKFAELIVKECAELMKKESEEYHSIGSDYCDNKAEAFDEAVDLVKKHFGVKS